MLLQGSNIACKFVHSGYQENQSRFLRKINNEYQLESEQASECSDASEEESDEENEPQKVQESGQTFKVHGREGLYAEATSIHDKYAARPKAVENLTLAQFATHYALCSKKPKKLVLKNGVSEEFGDHQDYLQGLYQ